jgi:MFS family permease
MLAAFVYVQTRASEPVLPLWVFTRRLLASASFVNLGVGGVVIALSAYVPTFLQGALDVTPIVAGLTLAALTVGWPIAAAQSGKFYLRIGFRNTILIGVIFALAGAVTLALTAGRPSILIVAVSCFVIGLGMGLIAVPSLVAAQSSVEWNQRAVVTGAQLFSRSIGSAVGVAVFGAIANAIIGSGSRASVHLIVQSSTAVFSGVVLVVLVVLAAALAMPNTRVVAPPAAVPAEA